ncbi:MAG: hypothetical protein GWP74_16910, partial [Proteobacteria bacterium]|nr:hypothetical protein [Pseudomonadota bacterium]
LTIERPSSNIIDLEINQGRYFATVLDDVMQVQSDLNQLSMWAEDASEQMKINIDTYALANVAGGLSADNVGLTAGRISGNINLGVTTNVLDIVARNPGAGEVEVIDAITRLGQVLDEQNIPETGRWLVAPAWFCAMVKRSELRDSSLTGDGQTMLRNGRLGMIDRFTVYMSNLLPVATGEYTIFAGHSHGLTFASQLSRVETIRSESTFGTILRGLQVFGQKVTDGTAIAAVIASPA